MERSYFIPMVFFGVVLIFLGLGGVYAMSLAEQYQAGTDADVSFWVHHMRLDAISTSILGLVITAWAFDRRGAYARLRTERVDARGQPVAHLRSLAFGLVLLIFAALIFLQLRSCTPAWVHYMRMRQDIKKVAQVRSVLTENGVPFAYVRLGSKGGRTVSVSLEGNDVGDIRALCGLPINYLDLRNTRVADLVPLKTCPLSGLILRGTPVNDISALAGTSIRLVDLRETGVVDLRPLARMPNLKEVRLSRDQIMANLDVLRNLDILVQMVDGGPAWYTSGPGWRQEFDVQDVSRPR